MFENPASKFIYKATPQVKMKTRKLTPIEELNSLIEIQKFNQLEAKVNFVIQVNSLTKNFRPINILKETASEIGSAIHMKSIFSQENIRLIRQVISIIGGSSIRKKIAVEVIKKFVLPAISVNLKTNTSKGVLFVKSLLVLAKRKSESL